MFLKLNYLLKPVNQIWFILLIKSAFEVLLGEKDWSLLLVTERLIIRVDLARCALQPVCQRSSHSFGTDPLRSVPG